jgi:hypothetical protein
MQIDYEVLRDACYNADMDPDTAIRPDYSGRGMYGAECLGIVISGLGEAMTFTAALMAALDAHGEEGENILYDLARDARQDNMGHDMIAYFPGVTVEGVPAHD